MKSNIQLAFLSIVVLCFSAVSGFAKPSTRILLTPRAPSFSDVERQTEFANRRAEVAKRIGAGSTLVMLSAAPQIYTNDVDFMYRQENNIYYLTGLKQNGARLVIVNDGDLTGEYLFLPKRNPQFETWNGRMYSVEDATRISGIKTIIDASEFDSFVKALSSKTGFKTKEGVSISTGAGKLFLLLPDADFDTDGKREYRNEIEFAKQFADVTVNEKSKEFVYTSKNGLEVKNASSIFGELRLVKSPYELKLLQHAIDITTEAQMRSMSMVGNANWEYEVQAEVEYTFRRRNADYWGYPSIVGCGPNATTLHYVESQGEIKKGSLLLMDVGAEYDHYTADVTRTFPVNGKFTKEQAEIYQVVYDAQEAVARAIRPGVKMKDLEKISRDTVEAGLLKLGLIESLGALIPGTEREVPDGKGGTQKIGLLQSRIWYMHGNSHWLGMNVHDVGSYNTPLAQGMVFTNEPGVYIREDALDYFKKSPEIDAFLAKVRPVYEKYKGIGVRIEDDMLVTSNGVEWMTAKLPRKISEIEEFMKNVSPTASLSKSQSTYLSGDSSKTESIPIPFQGLYGIASLQQFGAPVFAR